MRTDATAKIELDATGRSPRKGGVQPSGNVSYVRSIRGEHPCPKDIGAGVFFCSIVYVLLKLRFAQWFVWAGFSTSRRRHDESVTVDEASAGPRAGTGLRYCPARPLPIRRSWGAQPKEHRAVMGAAAIFSYGGVPCSYSTAA